MKAFSFLSMLIVACILSPLLISQPATVLTPVGDFDLRGCLPSEISPVFHAFAVAPDGLYFLVTPGNTPASQYIVKTDLSGKCIEANAVSEPVQPHFISVLNPNGITFLKRRAAFERTAIITDRKGNTISGLMLDEPVVRATWLSNQLVGLGESGTLTVYTAYGTVRNRFKTTSSSIGLHSHLCTLSSQRILLIDGKEATGQIIDSGSAVVSRPTALAPEDVTASLASGYKTAAAREQAVLVPDAVGDGKGHAYLCLSGIRLTEGALILKVDESGIVQQRLRCILPTRSANVTASNPQGFMFPQLISILDDVLYIADRRGIISRYSLKQR